MTLNHRFRYANSYMFLSPALPAEENWSPEHKHFYLIVFYEDV